MVHVFPFFECVIIFQSALLFYIDICAPSTYLYDIFYVIYPHVYRDNI